VTSQRHASVAIGAPRITTFELAGPATKTIFQGDPIQLNWAAAGYTSLAITSDRGEVQPGKQQLDPTTAPSPATVYSKEPGDVVYTLTATNSAGSTQRSVTVRVEPVRIRSFEAQPKTIPPGQPATLQWTVDGYNDLTEVVIEPTVGVVKGTGSVSVIPAENTTYVLRVKAADGTIHSAQAAVEVERPPVIDSFEPVNPSISLVEAAQLVWRVSNASRVEIRSSDGRRIQAVENESQGTAIDTPAQTTLYTIEAWSPANKSVTRTARVEVRLPGEPSPTPEPAPPPPSTAPNPAPAASPVPKP
jgi:hypothetical protein